ncbi:hypothetical protein [Pedobacter sp. SYSU D00535]|uniref:hypothetical protein n=1 Tax=Pedobacter sp. SYSU D00535 TaxID=2810308 RepID=UPI001A96D654|nr:hypothetical protein [Pedobacter sp. SYSU D00535]
METTQTNHEVAEGIYAHAADLLVTQGKNSYEVINSLVDLGLERDSASAIVNDLETELEKARKDRAKKDMLYGALWCVAGLALTLADTGFIFCGAIVFGGIQFFKGVTNL